MYVFNLISGIDLIPFMVTFLCCLVWKLEYGIIVGAGVQCVFILYNSARPNIRIETYKVRIIRYTAYFILALKLNKS